MRKMIAFFAALIAAVAAFVVSLRWLARTREDTPWGEAARPGKVVAVDGVAIHYVQASPRGKRAREPVIVMVHGFGGHTFSFRHQLAEFGREHRCVAIDLKGFGYSERPDGGDYSITEQARLVLGAMDALGIERAVLVGHSLGGEVVMRMAAEAPERAERLVLVASVSGDRLPTAPRLGVFRGFLPSMARLSALNAWRHMFYDRSQVDLKAIRDGYLAPGRIYGSMNTIWEMWQDAKSDRRIDYSRITMPVLILWAQKERIVPFASYTLRRLRKKLPHADVEVIPRTGHLLLEENPAAANVAIRRFLAGELPASAVELAEGVAQTA